MQALIVLVLVVLWATPAWPHPMGSSHGEYVFDGADAVAILTFRAEELTQTPEEAVADTRIEADHHACKVTKVSSSNEGEDLRIVASFLCDHAPHAVHIHDGFLARLPSGHAHVSVLIIGKSETEHLTVLAQPDIDFVDDAPPPLGLLAFVRAGIEHILTGADHLLFLLGLVLLPREASRKVRSIVWVLTAFTAGHTLSLAVATLGGVAPSARIVEPLVALSVAYVGLENLFGKLRRSERRAFLTFPFGLVHGFAFASGLLLVHLPRAQLPLALFGFNLGVEVGQLGVMALVLPPLLLLSARKPRAYDITRTVLSVGVAVAGVVWFGQRLLG